MARVEVEREEVCTGNAAAACTFAERDDGGVGFDDDFAANGGGFEDRVDGGWVEGPEPVSGESVERVDTRITAAITADGESGGTDDYAAANGETGDIFEGSAKVRAVDAAAAFIP